MKSNQYRIGQLSRMTGVPVRRIRFYSDKGLMPPKSRTVANYRVYDSEDVSRLLMICVLRAAGVSMSTIKDMVAANIGIRRVLEERLSLLEAELIEGRILAGKLRNILSSEVMTDDNIEEIWKMLNVTDRKMKVRIGKFLSEISKSVHPSERENVVNWHSFEFPSDPSPEQIAAWNTIYEMMADEDLRKTIGNIFSYNNKGVLEEDRPEYLEGRAANHGKEWLVFESGCSPESQEAQDAIAHSVRFDAKYKHMSELEICDEYLDATLKKARDIEDYYEQFRVVTGGEKVKPEMQNGLSLSEWRRDAVLHFKETKCRAY